MRIEIEVDELAFIHPKSREDVERELLEAGLIYWIARREIDQARARDAVRPVHRDLVDVLLSAPDVGEDSDFERIQDLGRPELEWDT
jgi:hypothetical protein